MQTVAGSHQTLTILVPVYNEEEALSHFFERMDPVIQKLRGEADLDVELLFTDNCSTDRTKEVLLEYIAERPHMHLVSFSRNVGFQRSILTGYRYATGDACVQIDVDLEDPPELILRFVEKWREGYAVVYGVRKKRHEPAWTRLLRSAFYSIIGALAEDELPRHAGDFRLIDRKVINAVCTVGDAQPYLRGIIASLGFRSVGITYDRSKRSAGESSFNIRSYFSMSIDGILQSSSRPLYLGGIVAAVSLGISLALSAYYLFAGIFADHARTGFFTLALLQLFSFSITMTCLGIMSLYIGRIYRQIRLRPISITVERYRGSGEDVALPNESNWPGTQGGMMRSECYLGGLRECRPASPTTETGA